MLKIMDKNIYIQFYADFFLFIKTCDSDLLQNINYLLAGGDCCHLLITFVSSLDPDQACQKETPKDIFLQF